MYKLEHESKGAVSHGISTCAGCGLEIVMRNVLSVVGDDIILILSLIHISEPTRPY